MDTGNRDIRVSVSHFGDDGPTVEFRARNRCPSMA
jgi:hypothetical protein